MFWIRKKQTATVDNVGSHHQNPIERNEVNDIVNPKKKNYKKILILAGIILFAVIVWVGVGAYAAISKIITKNTTGAAPFFSFLGDIDTNKLQGEGDGRINILLVGIGGAGHPGGLLADTIMVASLDPKNKKLALLSIPRDLYVPIEGNGQGKINSAHSFGESNKQKTGGGPEVLKKTVSNILDLPIHYYIRGDFDGFIKLIDALGGVTVDVKKPISDPYFPAENMEDYSPFYLKAGTQTLDGKTALKFSRSRETTSDFDRAARQQQVLVAMKDKALSAGILANPKKVTDIMKIIGDHVRTDLQLNEIERLVSLFKDVDTSQIVTKVLDNSSEGPLISSSGEGGYYLTTKTGNFKEVQRIVHEIFSDPYLADENAKIEVLNATGKTGEAKEAQDTLVSYGYNVAKIDLNDKELAQTVIYDYTGGKKPVTVEFLKKRFSAKVINQPEKQENVDITLILGKDYVK